MPIKSKIVVLVCLMATFNSPAQFYQANARMSGLGSTFIMDDMTDLLRYPVYINQYKNAIQATFNSPMIGVKSIGDLINVGLVANRRLMMCDVNTGFYGTANAFLTGNITLSPAIQTQKVPHVLVGLDLSAVSLGFDLFYEYASSHYKSETKGASTVTTTAKTHVQNPGLISSAITELAEIPILAKIGFSFPSISGNTDNGTTKTEIKSDKGFYWNVGLEGTLPVSDFKISVGTDLNFESYAFKTGDADPANIYKNNKLAFYTGIEGELFTSAKWGVLPMCSYLSFKNTTATDTTMSDTLIVSINCGIENSWTSIWIFDECFIRGGLIFSKSTSGTHKVTATEDTKTRYPGIYQPILPTIGIGVTRKAFKLDLTLNPSVWGGVMTGPAVGMVTGTFTF